VVKAGGVVDFGGTNTTAQGNAGTLIVDATLSKAVTVTGTSGVDSITGGNSADVITGGEGVDTIDGGGANDTFNYAITADLFTSSAAVDSVVGGDGVDTLLLGGTAGFTIATGDVWSRISDVEVVKSDANSAAVSITLGASAAVAGITKVDLSLTTATSGNVIDVSAFSASTDTTLIGSSATGVVDITGGAGIDKIIAAAGGGTITGGDGLDIITLGAGDDIVVLGTTEASFDTIVGFTGGSGNDIIKLGGATAADAKTVAQVTTGSYAGAAHNIVFDTAAHLGDLGVNIGDLSAEATANEQLHYAVASDTGAIYYDADANWTAGSFKIGTIGVVTGLTAADNFTVV
jgi:Ca2+-binding RTX toxin-like protein